MKEFKYRALDEEHQKIEGNIWAENYDEVKLRLVHKKYHLLAIEEVEKPFWKPQNKWKIDDIINFSLQMGMLLEAGLSLRTILALLADNYKKNKNINRLREGIEHGEDIAELLAKTGYPYLACKLVEVGKRSGNLGNAFLEVKSIYEVRKEQQEKTVQAMIYPAFVFFILICFFVVASLFILPNFQGLFQSLNVELPFSLKLFIGLSDLLQNHGLSVTGWIGVILLIFLYVRRLQKVQDFLDHQRWQIFSRYNWYSGFRYSCIFGMLSKLLKAGLTLTESLELINPLWNNNYVCQKMQQAQNLLVQGNSLAEALRTVNIGTPLIFELVAAGEASGALDNMLQQCGEYYQLKASNSIAKLQKLLEPVMMAVVGMVVGCFVIGLMLPIFDSMTSFTNY